MVPGAGCKGDGSASKLYLKEGLCSLKGWCGESSLHSSLCKHRLRRRILFCKYVCPLLVPSEDRHPSQAAQAMACADTACGYHTHTVTKQSGGPTGQNNLGLGEGVGGENEENCEAGGYSRRSVLSMCVKAQQREKTP